MLFRFRPKPPLRHLGDSACGDSPEQRRRSVHFIPGSGRLDRVDFDVDVSTRGLETIGEFRDDELPVSFVADGVGVEFRMTRDQQSKQAVVEMKKIGHKNTRLQFIANFRDNSTGANIPININTYSDLQVYSIGTRTDYTVRFSRFVYDRSVTFSNIAKNPGEFTRVEISEVASLPPP